MLLWPYSGEDPEFTAHCLCSTGILGNVLRLRGCYAMSFNEAWRSILAQGIIITLILPIHSVLQWGQDVLYLITLFYKMLLTSATTFLFLDIPIGGKKQSSNI